MQREGDGGKEGGRKQDGVTKNFLKTLQQLLGGGDEGARRGEAGQGEREREEYTLREVPPTKKSIVEGVSRAVTLSYDIYRRGAGVVG